jgi:hypothetical protein
MQGCVRYVGFVYLDVRLVKPLRCAADVKASQREEI